jgi:hypothetical protein
MERNAGEKSSAFFSLRANTRSASLAVSHPLDGCPRRWQTQPEASVSEAGLNPSAKGAFAELAVANALNRAGNLVYVPWFNSHGRVDLVYVTPVGDVRRVQCKLAQLAGGVMRFWTSSHTGGVERDYVGQVDEFGAYCAETNLVYLVPIGAVPMRQACLRVNPTRSNQVKGIRWADDYVLGPPW